MNTRKKLFAFFAISLVLVVVIIAISAPMYLNGYETEGNEGNNSSYRVMDNVVSADIIAPHQGFKIYPILKSLKDRGVNIKFLNCVAEKRESTFHYQLNFAPYEGYAVIPSWVYPQGGDKEIDILGAYESNRDVKLFMPRSAETIDSIKNKDVYVPTSRHYGYWLEVLLRDRYNFSEDELPEINRVKWSTVRKGLNNGSIGLGVISTNNRMAGIESRVFMDLSDELKDMYGNYYITFYIVRSGDVKNTAVLSKLKDVTSEYRTKYKLGNVTFFSPITNGTKKATYKVWEMENSRKNQTRPFDNIVLNYSF